MLGLALLGAFPGTGDAARSGTIEIRGKGGSLGSLTPVSLDEGGSYLAAERLAAVLKGTWSAKGTRGTLTVGSRSAQFNRNQARVLIAGNALTLDSPARLGASGWLIPEDFLAKGLTRLVPGVTMKVVAAPAPATRATAKPVAAAAPTVPFEDLRLRSYPSFTRIVLETAGPVGYAIVDEGAERREIRMRLPGLRLAGPQRQEIDDGLVKELRLEPASVGAVLRIVLEASVGQVKDFALQDPYRIVLDLYRPREGAGPEGTPGGAAAQPLRLIVLDAGHGGHDSGRHRPDRVSGEGSGARRHAARGAHDGGERARHQGGPDPRRRRLRAPARPHQLRQQAAGRPLRVHSRQRPSARRCRRGWRRISFRPRPRDTEARQVGGDRERRRPARVARPRGQKSRRHPRASSGTSRSPSSSRSRASWPRPCWTR